VHTHTLQRDTANFEKVLFSHARESLFPFPLCPHHLSPCSSRPTNRIITQSDTIKCFTDTSKKSMNANHSQIKILVAEDAQVLCKLIEQMLSKNGFLVKTATDGEKALNLCKEWQPHIGLFDVEMPRLSGLEVIGELRSKNSQCRFIIMTGSKDIQNAQKAFELGADSLLIKPFKEQELLDTIAQSLHKLAKKVQETKERHALNEEIEKSNETLQTAFKALQTREQHLNLIVANISDGLLAVDTDLNIIILNPPAERLLQTTLQEVIGCPVKEVIKSQELLEQISSLIHECQSNKDRKSEKIISLQQSSETDSVQFYRARARAIEDSDSCNTGTIITLCDQTEHLKTEYIRQNILTNVSHELRTPTTSILSLVEMLETTNLDSEQKELFHLLSESLNSLLGLLDNVVDLTHVDRGQIDFHNEQISCARLCNMIIDELGEKKDGRDISIELEKTADLDTPFETDPAILKKILISLITYTWKYSTDKKIHIRPVITHCHSPEDPDTLQIAISHRCAALQQMRSSILFERLSQIDEISTNKYGGASLLLAIVKRFTDFLGGTVTLQSTDTSTIGYFISVPVKPMKNDKAPPLHEDKP